MRKEISFQGLRSESVPAQTAKRMPVQLVHMVCIPETQHPMCSPFCLTVQDLYGCHGSQTIIVVLCEWCSARLVVCAVEAVVPCNTGSKDQARGLPASFSDKRSLDKQPELHII
jgi:hypothetical protein